MEAPGKFHSATVLMQKAKARNTLSKGHLLLPLNIFFFHPGREKAQGQPCHSIRGSFTRRTEARSSQGDTWTRQGAMGEVSP